MKHILLFLSLVFFSTFSLAHPPKKTFANGSVWKSFSSPAQPNHDINIVYGGQDISRLSPQVSIKI